MEDAIKWAVTGLITFLSSFTIYKMNSNKKRNKELDDRISSLEKNKADTTYVDTKICDVKQDINDKINENKAVVKEIIATHVKTDDDRWRQLFSQLKDIKEQQNILLSKHL